jgi:alpha-tubulin suppressor-like RCC1 family protein
MSKRFAPPVGPARNEAGISVLGIVLTLVVVLVAGAVGWLIYATNHHSSQTTVIPPPSSSTPSGPNVVYRWGWYADGPRQETTTPTVVDGLSNVVQVAASNSFSLALSRVDGVSRVWVWGNDEGGQLALGKSSGHISTSTPDQVPLPSNIVSIGEGRDFGLAVDANGNVWAWGNNDEGQLCLGDTKQRDRPIEVPGLHNVVQAVGGDRHSLFLLSNGMMMACGQNPEGQLGDGQFNTGSTTPVNVDISGVKYISSGSEFSAALKTDGTLWMWGNNTSGQLGDGTKVNADVPVEVKIPNGLTVREVFAGGDYPSNGHTLALLSNGTAWAWGNNKQGQLGDGRRANSDVPVAVDVPNGVTFKYVAAGGLHSLALDENGDVWAWGGNGLGQLGDGQKEQFSTTPIKVDSGVTMIWTTANNCLDVHG